MVVATLSASLINSVVAVSGSQLACGPRKGQIGFVNLSQPPSLSLWSVKPIKAISEFDRLSMSCE